MPCYKCHMLTLLPLCRAGERHTPVPVLGGHQRAAAGRAATIRLWTGFAGAKPAHTRQPRHL